MRNTRLEEARAGVKIARRNINNLRCADDTTLMDFPGGSDGKASVYNVGDPGSSPGLGRSPGEGNGNPLQYYSPPGFSVHGILQAGILECVAMPSSRGSSLPKD